MPNLLHIPNVLKHLQGGRLKPCHHRLRLTAYALTDNTHYNAKITTPNLRLDQLDHPFTLKTLYSVLQTPFPAHSVDTAHSVRFELVRFAHLALISTSFSGLNYSTHRLPSAIASPLKQAAPISRQPSQPPELPRLTQTQSTPPLPYSHLTLSFIIPVPFLLFRQ